MFFIPRQRDNVPLNRAGRAIKKSANVCVSLAVNLSPTRILSAKLSGTWHLTPKPEPDLVLNY